MTITLTHTTAATGVNDGTKQISKDAWNEGHTITMATAKILGRATAGTGAVEELAATTASIAASANKNYVTDAQATVIGNTSGTNTGDQTISDATISTTDITTNDATTAKHGFLKKLDNAATHFMNGQGAWATPAGTGLSDGDYGDVTVSVSSTVLTVDSVTVADAAGDTTTWPLLALSQTGGGLVPSTDAGLTYNATTNALTATTFAGALTGTATLAAALTPGRTIGGVAFDGTANIVPQTIQSINEATDTTCFPLFISASGTQSLQPLNNANLTFNSNTGALGATSFVGSTAASTITGTTIAAGVTISSLTTVGTIGTGVWQGTAVADSYVASAATWNAKAAASQIFQISGFIETPSNKAYRIATKIPYGCTINSITAISTSGSCTLTGKIDTVALGGTANSVTSVEQEQTHASANTVSTGNDIDMTVSSNSACADLAFTVKFTRTLA